MHSEQSLRDGGPTTNYEDESVWRFVRKIVRSATDHPGNPTRTRCDEFWVRVGPTAVGYRYPENLRDQTDRDRSRRIADVRARTPTRLLPQCESPIVMERSIDLHMS